MSKAKSAATNQDVPYTLNPRVGKRVRRRPKEVWRKGLLRRDHLGCLLLALCFIVACSPWRKDYDEAVAPPPLPPLFAFLESAEANEVGVVEDPGTGAKVRVIAGRPYHAASGRLCRRFDVMSPHSYEGMTEGLACKDNNGRWTKSTLLINPDDLESPRLRLP